MADKNKVRFGLENLYIGTYEVNATGEVTLGEAYKQPGAVDLTLDVDASDNDFYADNVKYWFANQFNSLSGDLEVAKFDDQFCINFMGYKALEDGGLAQIKGAQKKNVYICGEGKGDAHSRRFIMYNAGLGSISQSYHTTEESTSPITEKLPITVVGDNATGIVMVTYNPDDTGYGTLFTNPPKPKSPTL